MARLIWEKMTVTTDFSEDALVRWSALWGGQGWPLSLHHVPTAGVYKEPRLWRRGTSTNPSASQVLLLGVTCEIMYTFKVSSRHSGTASERDYDYRYYRLHALIIYFSFFSFLSYFNFFFFFIINIFITGSSCLSEQYWLRSEHFRGLSDESLSQFLL